MSALTLPPGHQAEPKVCRLSSSTVWAMQRSVIHRSASTHRRLRPGGPFVRHAISSPATSTRSKRGHGTENSQRIFMSGQKRGAFGARTYKSRRMHRHRTGDRPSRTSQRSRGQHHQRHPLRLWPTLPAYPCMAEQHLLRLFLIVMLHLSISRSAFNPASSRSF